VLVPLWFDRSTLTLVFFQYDMVARLKPGISLAQADADLGRITYLWGGSWPMPRGYGRGAVRSTAGVSRVWPARSRTASAEAWRLLMTATSVASYVPARGISRFDPAVAMRGSEGSQPAWPSSGCGKAPGRL
jgi:hypothetical protein